MSTTSSGHYWAHRSAYLARFRAYRAKNAEAISARKREAYLANRPARLAAMRTYNKANAHLKAELNAARRQIEQIVMPWKDVGLIRDIYRLARIHREAGIQCSVDHIVPLRHKLVTGLHVQQNLTVLLKDANSSKGNRWWPDMPAAA